MRLILAVAIVSGLALFALLVWSTGNASRFAHHYDLLLLFNGVLAVALIGWVVLMSLRLARQIRRRQFGARLTARFALSFALVGVLPGAIIYLLSVQFMSRSIESWFNVRVENALEAGLNLGRGALDTQLEELTGRARLAAQRLADTQDADMANALLQMRETVGAVEAMIFAGNGRLLAFSSSSYGQLIPEGPPPHVLSQLRVARLYAEAEADEPGLGGQGPNNRLHLRVVVPIPTMDRVTSLTGAASDSRWLQVIQPVPEDIARNASLVQQGFSDYQELALSRTGLRKLYSITLTLALVLSVFAALVAALALSRRLVRPLLSLAAGTQAVAVGDYRPLPEPPERDEVGQLTRSFNAMTRQLDEARRMVEANRLQLERSNVYLESVLSNLSSGVLVFDEGFRVTLFNQGAQNILHADLRSVRGCPLETVEQAVPFAQHIRQAFAAHAAVESEREYWQQQFELELPHTIAQGKNRHVLTLLARGTHMSLDGRNSGYLVVFDDISEVISANRAVAWAEVARRLAHEIKNPLTPIQLSAERLAHKLSDRLPPQEAAMLKRATDTIVNQVASLKQMVDDFREYARTPPAQMQPVNLNALVADVLTLYGWDPSADRPALDGQTIRLTVSFDPDLPLIEGDATQLRQVIHNLLANARDALQGQADRTDAMIDVQTRLVRSELEPGRMQQVAHLKISDNGPGFEPQVLSRVFEPYVTTKSTGTGLGLAIVRKIIEEHGGRIDVSNRRAGGARISILFTRFARAPTGMDDDASGNDNAANT